MQRLFTLLIGLVLSSALSAQEVQTLTATITRTQHKTAVAEDRITQGDFYFKQPGRMCMTFLDGTDRLLMDGSSFIIQNNKKSSVAKGKEAKQLELLRQVLLHVISGGDGLIDIPESMGMRISKQDNTLSIAPVDTSEKAMRRMMFTSFTLTVEPESSQLRSMRMNERGGNYTQYDFSDYTLNDPVDDEVFDSKSK